MFEKFKKMSVLDRVLTIAGIVLIAICLLALVLNTVIIVKGIVTPDKPPSIFGVTPMIVLSGSMSGDAPDHIEIGDLIFVVEADYDTLQPGQIITFVDGGSYTTHRIVKWDPEYNGYLTKGDANNAEDPHRVTRECFLGVAKGRIPFVGDLFLFMQQPYGMAVVVGVPIAAYIIYDLIKRKRYEAKKAVAEGDKDDEIARLKAQLAAQQAAATELASDDSLDAPLDVENDAPVDTPDSPAED